MSGTYNKKDSFFVTSAPLTPYDEVYIINQFDEKVDSYIEKYKKDIREENRVRGNCWTKVLLFPIQLPISFLFSGKLVAKELISNTKLSISLLRRKITVDKYKKELTESNKNVRLWS